LFTRSIWKVQIDISKYRAENVQEALDYRKNFDEEYFHTITQAESLYSHSIINTTQRRGAATNEIPSSQTPLIRAANEGACQVSQYNLTKILYTRLRVLDYRQSNYQNSAENSRMAQLSRHFRVINILLKMRLLIPYKNFII